MGDYTLTALSKELHVSTNYIRVAYEKHIGKYDRKSKIKEEEARILKGVVDKYLALENTTRTKYSMDILHIMMSVPGLVELSDGAMCTIMARIDKVLLKLIKESKELGA